MTSLQTHDEHDPHALIRKNFGKLQPDVRFVVTASSLSVHNGLPIDISDTRRQAHRGTHLAAETALNNGLPPAQ